MLLGDSRLQRAQSWWPAKVPLRDEPMLGEQVGTQTGPLPPQFANVLICVTSGHDIVNAKRTHSTCAANGLKKATGSKRICTKQLRLSGIYYTPDSHIVKQGTATKPKHASAN